MNYNKQHLLEWLKSHSCISLHCIETQANCPKNTLRHFVKQRRELPQKHYTAIVNVLYQYGYTQLDSE